MHERLMARGHVHILRAKILQTYLSDLEERETLDAHKFAEAKEFHMNLFHLLRFYPSFF